ncbi:MAG: hypothetical protein GY795_13070 [Desulfobacterales bacterium]|nr:hypothetical protein [Desulfobacterales bacterium]
MILLIYIHTLSDSELKLSYRLGPQLPDTFEKSDFKFAVIGDSHSFSTSIKSILLRAKKRGCSFAVHTGDFVDLDSEIEYSYFIHRVKNYVKDFPLFLVRGNHETMSPDNGFSNEYLKYIPKPAYQFIYSDCLFAILDSSSGELGLKQITDLFLSTENFRKTHPNSPVFAFLHVPPKYEKILEKGLPDWESMNMINMLKTNNISYMFSGHYHSYHELKFGKSFLMVNGCAGGSFYGPSPEVFYLEITVGKDGISHEKVFGERDILYISELKLFLYVLAVKYPYLISFIAVLIITREIMFLLKSYKNRL